jgi:hypothetical protein
MEGPKTNQYNPFYEKTSYTVLNTISGLREQSNNSFGWFKN